MSARIRENLESILSSRLEERSMLHKEEIKKKIAELLEKANEVDLKLFLIFIEGYLRKKKQ